ncbi:MAG TPA: AMP-binding protein [Thermoanaerobaculia bacterium]
MFDGDLIAERARITPEKIAIIEIATGERLTYAHLHERTERAAAAIRAAGVGAGDRYGILAHNCADYLAFFFAAARTGAIVVPLSTRATAHELEHVVEDCAMKALWYGPEFAAISASLTVNRQPLTVPSPGASRHPLPRAGEGENVHCLLYTSGTTGKPKGVMIPRRQLLWNGYNTVMNWGLRDDDVSPVFTPMYHAGGLAAFLIPIFCAGGTVVLHKSFDVTEIWRTIERERCTVVLGVPTIWKMLMDAPEFATARLDHVRWFISGGAPLPAYIIDAYQERGVVFKQGYGMTEVGVNCFTMSVGDSYRKPGSIGRPMMFTDVRLLDSEGREVKTDEIGEMYIRGPHVSLGYWQNEAATNDAYSHDGWFRTGDLARRDEDGFFYIAGRRKEMFITGGVNVYPAEIEAELVQHPAVSDAAVVAIPDETWGEVGVAFVVAHDVSPADLGSYLTLRISKYKVPKQFVFVDVLPRTPYGKVEKGKLRDQLF